VKRLITSIVFVPLLISLVSPGGALAQQAPAPAGVEVSVPGGPALFRDEDQPAAVVAPARLTRPFLKRFDVVAATEHFDQVLMIVDFPGGTWTPLHTPGGRIYHTVIDGTISTRLPWTDGVYAATYQAGETFVLSPGEYIQVGNPTAGNTRIMATALLPTRAPLTIYTDGFTSNAYPTLADWNYTHDIVVPASGPSTAYRSAIEVDRPGGAFELVQLVLEPAAIVPQVIIPGYDARESCVTAWGRVSTNLLDVKPYVFERVAANLCVSSTYMPVSADTSRT
jgi:hypothetical protein